MKKNLLIAAVLFLSLSGNAFCAEAQFPTTQSDIHQKACQNVFSFINIDLSLMSPRGTMADSKIDASTLMPPPPPRNSDGIVPITNRSLTPCPPPPLGKEVKEPINKGKTSLFRLDLFHMFKIQIL